MLEKELNNLSEAELLDLYYKGKNSKALGALFQYYLPQIFAVCMYYLKNRDKAKDASSEVVIKLLKYFEKNEVKKPKALIMLSAKNYCLNLLNKQQYLVNVDEIVERYETEKENDEKLAKEARYEQLEHCLEQLKEDQKLCVKLFYLEKKSYQDIVSLTGMSLKKVKSNIQNGKRMLRILLENKMGYGNE